MVKRCQCGGNHAAGNGERCSNREYCHWPEGSLRDDQMSWAAQSADSGGQLITGNDVLPATVGPSPLLRPATATNMVGRPSPKRAEQHTHMFTCEPTSMQIQHDVTVLDATSHRHEYGGMKSPGCTEQQRNISDHAQTHHDTIPQQLSF